MVPDMPFPVISQQLQGRTGTTVSTFTASERDAGVQVSTSGRPGHGRRSPSRTLPAGSGCPLRLYAISIPVVAFSSWLTLAIPVGPAYNAEEMLSWGLGAPWGRELGWLVHWALDHSLLSEQSRSSDVATRAQLLWCCCLQTSPCTSQSVQHTSWPLPLLEPTPPHSQAPGAGGGDDYTRYYLVIKKKNRKECAFFFFLSFGCIKMLLLSKWPHRFTPPSPQMQPVSASGSWGCRAESATSAVWREAAIESCDQGP